LSESQIQFRGRECGLGGPYRGLGCSNSGVGLCGLLLVVVKLALGNGSRLGEWSVALQIDLREALLRFCLGKLPLCTPDLRLGLVYCGLKRTRIYLKKNLIFSNRSALAIILPDQVSANLRLNLRVDVAIECPDLFACQRHIRLPDFDH